MEVNRRTGIGALLGGIFAGPQVAKQAVESSMSEAVQQVAKYGGGDIKAPTPMAIAEKEEQTVRHVRARIKYLKRVINGDLDSGHEEEDEYYSMEYGTYDDRIDHTRLYVKSLKSVSEAAKEHIEYRHNVIRHIERCKESAKTDLERLVRSWAKQKLWGRFSDLFE